MSAENQTIEAHGSSVDEAIANGLAKLGKRHDDVDIEVLDEGRRGLLGIGGRDAVVRLRVKSRATAEVATRPAAKPPAPAATIPPPAKVAAPPPRRTPTPAPARPEATVAKEEPAEPEGDQASEAETAVEVVRELLELMGIDAEVDSRLSEVDDLTRQQLTIVDIHGDDLGLLIGARGETLDAMQYIARLMVGHRLRQRARLVIDVEGYRQRREQALTQMALRMARKATKRGSAVTLEAMPPHERRIIHMALRNSTEVYTESTGEGNRRRVRIFPK